MTLPSSAACLLAVALCAGFTLGQTDAPPAATKKPPAESGPEVLAKALRFVQSLPALRCKVTAKFVMPELPDGAMGQIEFAELPDVDVDVVVALPSRLAVNAREPIGSRLVVDGKQMLRAVEQFEMYELVDAPKDLLKYLGKPNPMFALPTMSTLRALLSPAGAKGALLDAKQVELLGTEKVGGRDCHHLKVADEKLVCELWIALGDEPWVVRHKPAAPKLDLDTLRNLGAGGEEEEKEGKGEQKGDAKADDEAEGEGVAIQLTPAFDCTFTAFAKEPGKDAFAIEAPKGYERVDSLEKAMRAKWEEQAGQVMDLDDVTDAVAEAVPHASVGKPAPAATFELLGGEKVTLADLAGKVVLLDFWATWCGPCVAALPKVVEVAARLKDQGIVFLAVNSREDKATIQAFLDKQKLDLRVALGTAAHNAAFGVESIPHTVVIGRDGAVHAVHVGFAPGSEAQLQKDLEAALAKPAPKKETPKDEPKKDEPKK